MAYQIAMCKAVDTKNLGNNIIIYPGSNEYFSGYVMYLENGYNECTYSTTQGNVVYSHSCAHNSWNANTKTYRINMDNALRNAINSKINSGGLIDLTNYLRNIPEFIGKDMNGNNTITIQGFVCKNRSITGSFDVSQLGNWEGNWPYNFPTTVAYGYNIPGVGSTADSIMLITDGWYTRGSTRTIAAYDYGTIERQFTYDQILSPPNQWHQYQIYGPLNVQGGAGYRGYNMRKTFGYYTINGIYSRNAGTRNCYADNAADVMLNANSNYFGGLTLNSLITTVGAPNKRMYAGNVHSVTNNIIMAVTEINMQDNYIIVKFAMTHDRDKSMVAFVTGEGWSIVSLRMHYNYPVTVVRTVQDNWRVEFVSKTDFNPGSANGNGASTLIWDSQHNAVALTAGVHVNNSDGYSKIISRSSGTLNCSCMNANNTIRVSIGGYTITVPSNVSPINIRILSINNGQIGYWRIYPPGVGLSHAFNITYPSTADAPIASLTNELYSAINQAMMSNGTPFGFELSLIGQDYQISVTGAVRCDLIVKENKRYYAISIYDVNGDFSALLNKNGYVTTVPVTITADIQVVNNTVLIKAGMASIGYTNTSIGDVNQSIDAIAVMLPTVATVSKNGSRIGYATTTVNQNSFAFSFSALKEEVEQTDDFVSHYLQ